MAEQKTIYTKEGFQKLKDELEYLKTTRRAEVGQMLKEARSFGDLSENSEYDEARDQQAKVESRIAELEYLIKNGVVMSDEDAAKNIISIGTTVTIRYKDGRESTYDLVGSNEVEPLKHKISDLSPIGMALIGHKEGDDIIINTPSGEKEITVVSFERTKK
ncbi:MAG: transcription elongation factor GreA [Eubacteriales bacterium]